MSSRPCRTATRLAGTVLGVLGSACFEPAAHASPLTMFYSVTPVGGGLFDYQFRLVLDNRDGTWAAGQSWGWVIFGDSPTPPSPFADFIGDPSDLPIGPWTAYTSSTGAHNGATLDFIFSMWTPAFLGDQVAWSGTSASSLGPGSLLWSCLVADGGATPIEFAVALEEGSGCPADFDGDGFVSGDDFDAYVVAFELGTPPADFDRDGFVTGDDFDKYVLAFEAGC